MLLDQVGSVVVGAVEAEVEEIEILTDAFHLLGAASHLHVAGGEIEEAGVAEARKDLDQGQGRVRLHREEEIPDTIDSLIS